MTRIRSPTRDPGPTVSATGGPEPGHGRRRAGPQTCQCIDAAQAARLPGPAAARLDRDAGPGQRSWSQQLEHGGAALPVSLTGPGSGRGRGGRPGPAAAAAAVTVS
jgi:hypothetical protein